MALQRTAILDMTSRCEGEKRKNWRSKRHQGANICAYSRTSLYSPKERSYAKTDVDKMLAEIFLVLAFASILAFIAIHSLQEWLSNRPSGKEKPILRRVHERHVHATFQKERWSAVDDVTEQIEVVRLLYQQLDLKISDKGGLGKLLGMQRDLRKALDAISLAELDMLLVEIKRAKEALSRLQEDVVQIRVLKQTLGSSASD